MGLFRKFLRARNKRKFKGNFGDRLREFNFRVRGNNMGKFQITRPTSQITANKHNLRGKLIGKSMEQVSRNLAMKAVTASYLLHLINSDFGKKKIRKRKTRKSTGVALKSRKAAKSQLSTRK